MNPSIRYATSRPSAINGGEDRKPRIVGPMALILVAIVLSPAPAAEFGASSAHSQHNNPPGFNQVKRIGQYVMKQLLLGQPKKAEAYARKVIKRRPDNAEMHFLLALALAHQGEKKPVGEHLEHALQQGLPPGRLIAGPRRVTEPLQQTETYQRVLKQIKKESGLLHGPMVGAVSDESAPIWIRTPDEAKVKVLVAQNPQQLAADPQSDDAVIPSESRTTRQADDYTATVRVTGLQPETKYHYRVMVDGKLRGGQEEQSFRTRPKEGKPAKFRIAFGGGAGYVPPNERMWNTIGKFNPGALLLLGDNIYSDDPKSPGIQRYSYYRRQSRPEWRRLVAHTPVSTIWDDHDFSNNDSWGGPHPRKPAWKPHVWKVFQQNWANPGYGGGPKHPGCYYRFSIGDVEFFMLDCRYYRTSPRLPKEERSMLGPVQKQWLKKHVKASDATFKVLLSSVPWDFRTKGNSPDTWNGYRQERHEIFGYLAEQEIGGVVLMSADRHRSDAWRIDKDAGLVDGMYVLYEFNSSRLTNQHVHGEKSQAIFSYNDKQSFGLVTFDTTAADPKVTYEVINIDGKPVEELTLRRSDLDW